MNPQDFKALLDVLNRIAKALETEKGETPHEVVNRFSVVFRQLKVLKETLIKAKEQRLVEIVEVIIETYIQTANEVLNENKD
jgi:hypothetical protein